MDFLDEFQHLLIPLEKIKLATDNFSANNEIGKGGFGKVYEGAISHSKGRSMAAFKRLDRVYGQGDAEFLKEIVMLSRYTHENLVSLLGYCDQGGEKILVYEHASRGSLDRYLSATTLTWRQRLKICLAAARALSYLHDPKETHQRLIHRDIKCSNILLDENWNAKVSDLGLSKIGPANQQHTVLVTNVVGTYGYVDPLYLETYRLTKESDVYSFGVVMFEVLCGRLCHGFSSGQWEILVPTWKQICKDKKTAEIIFQDLMQQMDSSSLKTFSDIAYQCLQRSREERPTMAHVVQQLEIALEFQDIADGVGQPKHYEEVELPKDYEEMIKTAVPPLIYRSKDELDMLLYKGILVNGGKTWFSLNKEGEHIEMISAAECFTRNENPTDHDPYSAKETSRFAEGGYLAYLGTFETHVRTRFLTPRITYTVNLVFKEVNTLNVRTRFLSEPMYLALTYKLKAEAKSSISYLADERENGWMSLELYQFTSEEKIFDLEIQFMGVGSSNSLIVEGIEFRPLEKVEHEVLGDEKVDLQLISDLDTDWERKLPNDYEEIIQWSEDNVQWTTKKELYFLLCKGFLINNNGREGLPDNDCEEWFSLAKNGKKCHMLSARAALQHQLWSWQSIPESRFAEVAFNPPEHIRIACQIRSQILSPQTTYAIYLVYKLPENHSSFEAPVRVKDNRYSDCWYIYLLYHQTPVIRPKVGQNTQNRLNRPKIKGLPHLRNDGWMEVQVWEFHGGPPTSRFWTSEVTFTLSCTNSLYGLTVQGIEYKPI